MYHRIFDIENRLDEAMFLFGGRQTGKSTLLKERLWLIHPRPDRESECLVRYSLGVTP